METVTCDKLAQAPACSAPLVLREVLDQYYREAEQGECNTGRYRCKYYVWGQGPALVFIPGLCDDRLSFVMPIARLRARFRCIAYDLPAGSPWATYPWAAVRGLEGGDGARLGRYRHGDYVSDLLALLDHLRIRQAYLFGSSFGSTIALGALGLEPARFPRAVLQGGFARRPLAKAELLLASLARYWPGTMARLPFRTVVLHASHQGAFEQRDPEIWNFFLQRCGAPPMAAVARRALTVHRLDLRPLLPHISHPILLVCGEQDPIIGKKCEEELLRNLPRVVRAEIEGCGHLPQFTHPEVLAELVERYLTAG